jgi:hypothetical protein
MSAGNKSPRKPAALPDDVRGLTPTSFSLDLNFGVKTTATFIEELSSVYYGKSRTRRRRRRWLSFTWFPIADLHGTVAVPA